MTLNSEAEHRNFMMQAVELAEKGVFTARPNPSVGALIVANNTVVGRGFTQSYGQNHAEIEAIHDAGDLVKGGTLYVTLEPCCHSDKTPPCTEAIIAAGISRVFYGSEDPNPSVQGMGIKQLKQAGIAVYGAICDSRCRQVNRGFFKRHAVGVPYIRVKMAMSLDGRTAMADGNSFWITSSGARGDVQLLRAKSCAVISSGQSVVCDNAALTFRPHQFQLSECPSGQWGEVAQPLRVLLDSKSKVKRDSLFFKADTASLIFSEIGGEDSEHCQYIKMQPHKGELPLATIVAQLARRNCNEVLVEAGPNLAGSFIRQGLVDELIVYMAPKIMGCHSRPLFNIDVFNIDAALPFHIDSVVKIGRDLKIVLFPEFE